MYTFLNRRAEEEQAEYEKRVTRMLPFVAGRAFFDLRNYDAWTGRFSVYIEWDEEVNKSLAYPLPSGGYFVKATLRQAYELHELEQGFPVYMKPVVHQGRLYSYRTYMVYEGRPFSVEFDGCVLIPFEDRYEELGCAAAGNKSGYACGAGSQSSVHQSSRRGMMYGGLGSQYVLAYGSQGWRLGGSQRALVSGSQTQLWSYLRQYMQGSGYRPTYGSQGWRLSGSQRALASGSQTQFWSYLRQYMQGSGYRQVYGGLGSQGWHLGGSQRALVSGSQTHIIDRNGKKFCQSMGVHYQFELPQEWQLINRGRRPERRTGGGAGLGYGLDLL